MNNHQLLNHNSPTDAVHTPSKERAKQESTEKATLSKDETVAAKTEDYKQDILAATKTTTTKITISAKKLQFKSIC